MRRDSPSAIDELNYLGSSHFIAFTHNGHFTSTYRHFNACIYDLQHLVLEIALSHKYKTTHSSVYAGLLRFLSLQYPIIMTYIKHLLSGPIFEVQTLSDDKTFHVHAVILAQSETFKAITYSGWKEGVERRFVLDDWDVSSVEALVEYLYTNDFSWPLPQFWLAKDFAKDDMEVQTKTPLPVSHLRHPPDGPRDKIHGVTGVVPLTPLLGQDLPRDTSMDEECWQISFQKWIMIFQTFPNPLSEDSRSSLALTLLAHVKIYCLADYTLLPNLKALAFHRIRTILVAIQRLAPLSAIGPLTSVISFVYANTSVPREGEEPLRKLISTFIAIEFQNFDVGDEIELRGFLERDGEFVVDLWNKVRRKMAVICA